VIVSSTYILVLPCQFSRSKLGGSTLWTLDKENHPANQYQCKVFCINSFGASSSEAGLY